MTDPSGSPQPELGKTPSPVGRRGLVLAGLGLGALAAVGAARWYNIAADLSGDDLTVQEALRAAEAGEVLLIDIRRPDEWARTGIGRGAIPIDMRRPDFTDVLLAQAGGVPDRPIALICARGVRSARLAARLEAAGFTTVLNVPEGMLGSGAGPGWLQAGLPVVRP
ncbi:MAG: rhodanese-like domain-containing protein [Sulfitobacter sp.]|nr:rhodanese-like domain-containing protein [Sulfitobacter sp.]